MAKRVIDVVVSGLLLTALVIPMLVLALMTRIFLGSPVLYRARRPGLGGQIFTMYKFRTMTQDTDESGVLLPDAKRLTPFGRFMRSLSLDELPELLNVLMGDMSLVGPRPLLPEYLDLYSATQARRHEVRPGITGLAQITGRNALDWEERLALDVWYVDNRSMMLDMRILASTLRSVVTRTGISADDHATMPEFRGTADP
jgi:lipopolysaccharide/colanic/teichoic acid biosynthesis glycosyltransferase